MSQTTLQPIPLSSRRERASLPASWPNDWAQMRPILGRSAEERAKARALDQLAMAVMTAESDGRITVMNHAAQRLVALRDGLAVDGQGRLCAAEPAATARLLSEIAKAAAGEPGEHGPITLARPSLKQPLLVTIAGASIAPGDVGPRRPSVVLLVSDLDERPRIASQRLARLYGLTPAEQRLAEALVDGLCLSDAAAHLNITIATARSRLKQVMAKTNCSRQADLIRLALTAATAVLRS